MKKLLLNLKNRIHKPAKKWINGTKGVISLFMAILMVPFATIAGSLINAARINSAVAIFDEALCNASNSTLGTYDSFLKKRFGLLAMSQNVSSKGAELNQYTVSDLISETFEMYMNENLKSLNNTYTATEVNVTGVYPLSNEEVLYTQIMEYSKYSVPTQLVIDGLSLNDVIANLEKNIPGANILNMITSGATVANNMVTLAEDFDLLKDAVAEQMIAETNYENAYTTFSGAITQYHNTKYEMEVTLEEKERVIETERAKVEEIINQLETMEKELAELKQLQASSNTDYTEQITQKETDLQAFKNEHSEDLQPWYDAQRDYENTKSSYETQLATLLQKIKDGKTTYATAIGTLNGKLAKSQEMLAKVQTDILTMGNSVAGMATTALTAEIDKQKAKNDALIKQNEAAIASTTDPAEKSRLENENIKLREENDNLGNQKTVADAQKTGYDAALGKMKTVISAISIDEYTTLIEDKLTPLKTRVENYDTDLLELASKPTYYEELPHILSSDQVEQAEKDMVAECAKASIWGLIDALFGFIEALFKVSTVFDSKLNAVIDAAYYEENYGGLPGDKDRDVYPLSMGESSDAALSLYYKELIGGHPTAEMEGLSGMDVIQKLFQIFTDMAIISADVTAILSIVGLFNLATRINRIMDAIDRIVDNIGDIISHFANMFSESAIGSKMLLAGYASYMTSNRTTYTQKALNGSFFNMRGQTTGSKLKGANVFDFLALVETIMKAVEGGTDKCFYGAETEYLIFGSGSELVNQSATFLVIYGVRLLYNIVPILSNPEVQSIAAASTIAAPLVDLLFILIEPLVDAVILVNGGKLPILKNYVYLTPSGLPKLIKNFTKLNLPKGTIEDAQSGLLESLKATSCAESVGNMDIKDTSLLDIDYSQHLYLILLIVVSPERILERTSNIIEMESVEYMINKGMGSNGKFDLDYSYTYIRAEASFTTNEFIRISEESGFDTKKRILYRGY